MKPDLARVVLVVLLAARVVAPSAQAPTQESTWQIARDADAAGFDGKRLAVLREWLKTQHTTAVVVWSHGKVAFQYGDVARISKVASVRKSILAMLYGKYVVNGTIDLDATVKQLGLDDVQPFQQIEERATLLHLLTARSGIYLPAGNAELEALSPKRGSHQPGTYFQYQNWDFNAAGTAFEKRTGKDLFDALDIDLARPIGMEDFDRRRQRKIDVRPASVHPEYAMYLSTRDMARIGALMARQGQWNGREVVPREWIRRSSHWSHRRKTSTPSSWVRRAWRIGGVTACCGGYGIRRTSREPSPARTRARLPRWAHTVNTSPCFLSSTWSWHIRLRSMRKMNARAAGSRKWRRTNTTPFCR